MKKAIFSMSCLGLMLGGAMSPLQAQTVYPTPQKSNYASTRIPLPGKVMKLNRDNAKDAKSKWLKEVPEVSGAYLLKITPDGVIMAAHDKRGLFYASQTLNQLKDAQGNVPVAEIVDWPDLPFRGTVEGFYGPPWSHQARLNQLKFYGKYKLNTYIYGPKDDPYHSRNWREPYPAEQEKQIRELVKVAKENHVDFVWAIHPGHSIKWTDEDMNNVIKKFELMYQLGVRSFSVFFDDISGEGTKGDMQSKLLNKINDEFVKKKGDVTPLVMCPTQYNKGWSSGEYLDVLGNTLDKSINIMWTGDGVCADITMPGQEWINNRIKRPAYIWWNYPVTDYAHSALPFGRVYGLPQGPGAKESMSGFVSNPMDKPEASMIGLFGIADYAWNINKFNSTKSWKEGIKILYPSAAEAMQTFAHHNSDLGPNYHGFRREESVEIKPVVDSVLTNLKNNKYAAADTDKLLTEFKKIQAAPNQIRKNVKNQMLLEEMGPWLNGFEQLGAAGTEATSAIKAANTPNSSVVEPLVMATRSLARLDYIDRTQNHAPGFSYNGVRTGNLVMLPAVKEIVDTLSKKAYTSLSGKPSIVPKAIANQGKENDRERMFDGDVKSFWHTEVHGVKGDWFGVDYGSQIPIRSISIAMGKNEKDMGDVPQEGQIELSRDMKSWVPLGDAKSGNLVTWEGDKPIYARAIRYKALADAQNNGNPAWIAVREIAINEPAKAKVETNVPALKNLSVSRTDKLVGINRVMEVHSMAPQQYIHMKLPNPINATWMEIGLENSQLPEWGEVTLDIEGQSNPVLVKPQFENGRLVIKDKNQLKNVTGLKLKNKSSQDQDIAVTIFKLDAPAESPASNPASLNDSNLSTVYQTEQPFSIEIPNDAEPNATLVNVVGTAACDVYAQKGKSWVLVGKKKQGSPVVSSFKIPSKTSAIKLVSDQAQLGEVLNEVIFKKAKK